MRKAKKLNITSPIGKIYHVADIHIRNLKRHAEYSVVFDRLYEYIKSTMNLSDIIVVAGDVVHAKTDMTPEVIEMTQKFLKSLADLLPTILIPGNHDANLNNPTRMDALQPIVNALDHSNLFYLRDTGVWQTLDGEYTFSHQSVFDEAKGFIPSSEIKDSTKIALFHGAVDKIQTEHGFEIENKNINAESFDGYDIVLLGDIHVPNNAVRGNKRIMYPGSLIMQNHSESLYPEHGLLVWDVESRTHEFVTIENDFGYVTIDVEDGVITNKPKLPTKSRMRLRVKDTKQSDLNGLVAELKKETKIEELTIQKIVSRNSQNGGQQITLQNVRDVAFQNKLIEDYLTTYDQISDDQLQIVKSINNDINAKLGSNHTMKNSIWTPVRFEFSNMFSYGPNNVIDFTNMKGAYGIFAPNASGKSTLWDALAFCIFDKCSRTSKAEDVMNYSKMSFECKFTFDVNGEEYVIERAAKKSPKRGTVKVDVDFYKLVNGVKESLNGEQRRDTNFIIRDYVGTYDDFVLTAMSTQSNNSGFIDKSQKERKELLAQFLDMDVFEDLYQVASEEIKELSALLKDYKNQDLPGQLADSQTTLTSITGSLTELQTKKDELESKQLDIQTQISDYIMTLKPVEDIEGLQSLETKLGQVVEKLEKHQEECNSIKIELDDVEEKRKMVSEKLIELDVDKLKEMDTEWQRWNTIESDIRIDQDRIDSEIKHKQKHLDGIGSLTFDDNCEHCIQNKNTPFAKQADTLQKEIRELALIGVTRLGELETAIENKEKYNVKDSLEKVSKLKDMDVKLSKLSYETSKNYDSCNSLLMTYSREIDTLIETIGRAKMQEKAVEFNAQVMMNVNSLKITQTEISSQIQDINNEIMSVYSDIKIAEKTIEMVNQSIGKLQHMEAKYDGYEYYLKCVKRDGVPYQLISEILPKLEIEINNILQPIVDFQILLNTDGKNINSYICYGDDKVWPLELTSGMEKFVSSIAIRTALINVSNLPRPNFIAIDEGFGSLDTDNFNSLYLLFDYLKTQFDFIITISHIDKTRDMVDQIIDINKVKGFSSIRYL